VARTKDVTVACAFVVAVDVTNVDGEALPMTALHALERMVGPNGIRLAGVTGGPRGGLITRFKRRIGAVAVVVITEVSTSVDTKVEGGYVSVSVVSGITVVVEVVTVVEVYAVPEVMVKP